jgi:hypothetical protein
MKKLEEILANPLSCLLSHDQETNRWNGHCLDLDLATSAKDEEAAWEGLKGVVRMHIESCVRAGRTCFEHSASKEEFEAFHRLKEVQKDIRSEKIVLRLVPRNKADVPPIWMLGVEEGLGVESESRVVQTVH